MLTSRSIASWRRCLALAAALLAAPAWAWNAAGHRLVAAIAWSELGPTARERATELLHGHPDYASWAAQARAGEVDRDVFIESSLWADQIRKDPRFFDAHKEAPTPTSKGFPDMERRHDWHFLNRPLGGEIDAPALSGRLDRALIALEVTLATRAPGSLAERRYALPWLLHLVADAHQPLHASTRADGATPAAGEAIINPFNRRRPRSSLHAFWDDLPGPPWLRGERLERASAALIAAFPPPPAATSGEWLAESWALARDQAYPPAANVIEISAEFFEQSRNIANRRVSEAGYRLAELLNRILGER